MPAGRAVLQQQQQQQQQQLGTVSHHRLAASAAHLDDSVKSWGRQTSPEEKQVHRAAKLYAYHR